MKCPRCGGSLQTFRLSDNEASVCESCAYVGVTADLHPEPHADTESWEEALDRFHRTVSEDEADDETTGESSQDASADEAEAS